MGILSWVTGTDSLLQKVDFSLKASVMYYETSSCFLCNSKEIPDCGFLFLYCIDSKCDESL